MNQERVFKVLLGPHVSEKATVLPDLYILLTMSFLVASRSANSSALVP